MKNKTFQLQQDEALANWKPPNKIKGAVFFILIGVYMLVAGIVFNIYNLQVKEHKIEYASEDTVQPASTPKGCSTGVIDQKCQETLTITEDISGPVYVYYQLQSFFQNFQSFIQSYDPEQLKGNRDKTDMDNCDPKITNKQMNQQLSASKQAVLSDNSVAIPCGWRAYTYFNDTYQLFNQDGETAIAIDEKNISWEKDRKEYKNINLDLQWIDMTDEHFQVWMRPSGLSKFRKLWGQIQGGLQKGKYILKIHNNYNVSIFNSQKSFVVTNLSPIGGNSPVLAFAHIIGGIFSFIMAGVLCYMDQKEREEDKKEV